MKKLITGLIFFSLLPGLTASAETLRLGGFVGYFSTRDAMLEEIYGRQGAIFGARLSLRLWQGLSLAVSAAQYRRDGSTTLLNDDTRLTLYPVTLSLRYTFPLGRINPYIGGGYCRMFYKEESEIGGDSGDAGGYSLEAGLDIRLASWLRLDLGVAWNDVNAKQPSPEATAQLGGLQASAGLQLAF